MKKIIKKSFVFMFILLFINSYMIINPKAYVPVRDKYDSVVGMYPGRLKRVDPNAKYGVIDFVQILMSPSTVNGKEIPRVTKIKINGDYALCINPDDIARKGVTYVRTDQNPTTKQAQAYGLVKRWGGDFGYKLAQYYIFSGHNDVYNATVEYLENFGDAEQKGSSTIRTIADKAKSLAVPYPNAAIWESPCGGQKFISSYSGQVVITPANVLQGFVFASRRDIPGATTITMQVSSNNITIYGGINKNDSSVNHLDSMSFTDAPWPTNLADF